MLGTKPEGSKAELGTDRSWRVLRVLRARKRTFKSAFCKLIPYDGSKPLQVCGKEVAR